MYGKPGRVHAENWVGCACAVKRFANPVNDLTKIPYPTYNILCRKTVKTREMFIV